MSYAVSENWAVFFRAMSLAELSDARKTGALRPCAGTVHGKYLATSLRHALEWGRKFRELGWNTHGYVVRLKVPIEDAQQFVFLGQRLDGIGPAYFAEVEQLARAIVDTEDVHEI